MVAATRRFVPRYAPLCGSRGGFALRLDILLVVALFVQLSLQKDPINDFCRRFGHQTTVIDDRLFIDGGLVNWNPLASNPSNISNTWLLYNDLKAVNPGVNMPILHANLSKNGSVPNVSGGILWGDKLNNRFYLYGGEYFQSPPDNYNLLSYDAIYDKWDSFGPPSNAVESTSWGAGVGISERGEGYYYGGWQSNTTTSDYGSNPPSALSTMVKYSMDTNSWSVYAGPDLVPRAEGVMVYIPASDGGMLVYFGGISTPYGNDTMVGMPLSTIMLYDISNAKWYNQTATGDVPGMRRRFCAAASWPSDQSSYNIYLYGGLGVPPNGAGYDDVYILSIPSFTWTRYYPDTLSGASYPHHSMTCNIVNKGQMLVIGGTFPTLDMCDVPSAGGTHNLDLGRQNVLNTTWYQYLPNITTYVVPPILIEKIGGSSTGGATLKTPSTWSSPDLPIKFPIKATYAARTTQAGRSTATSSQAKSSGGISIGAIAGLIIAGCFIVISLLLLSLFLLRKHHKKKTEMQSLLSAQTSTAYEPHSPYQSTFPSMSMSTGPSHLQHSHSSTYYNNTQLPQQHAPPPPPPPPVELADTASNSPYTTHTIDPKFDPEDNASQYIVSAIPSDNSPRSRDGPRHDTYYHPTETGAAAAPVAGNTRFVTDHNGFGDGGGGGGAGGGYGNHTAGNTATSHGGSNPGDMGGQEHYASIHSGGTENWAELSAHRLSRGFLGDSEEGLTTTTTTTTRTKGRDLEP